MNCDLEEVVLEITKQCNMHCKHCGSSCGKTYSSNELSVEEWVACLMEFSNLEVKKVVFSGGEPTVKNGIDEIIMATVALGLNFGLITNGWDVKKSFISTLKKAKPFAVGVSLDGLKNAHNLIRGNSESWHRAICSISDLLDAGLAVCAITTVTKLNCKDVLRLSDFLALAGIKSWQLQLAMPAGRMKKFKQYLIDENEFIQLCNDIVLIRQKHPNIYIQAADCFGLAPAGVIREGNWKGCGAGIYGMGIDSEGNVLPCLSLRADLKAGNIRETSIKKIWEQSQVFDFNRKFKKVDAGLACKKCEYLMKCRGGCSSQSFSYFRHFHDSPFCYARSFDKLKQGGKVR